MARLTRGLGPLLGWAAVWLFFAGLAPDSFPALGTFETILRQASIVATAALGMTLVIAAGGIDLSAGSVVAGATVVVAAALAAAMPPAVAALAGMVAGAVCGALNGWLITRLRVTPFIVTLGTLLVIRGAAKGAANEQKIDAPVSRLNDLLAMLPPDRSWQIVPTGVWIMLGLAAVTALVVHRTAFGRQVLATGGNEEAARLSGIPVDRIKVAVYGLGGAAAGLAGVLQFSRLTVGDPTVAQGLELDVIAAVVIGGGSLAGGRASVSGAVIGALLTTTIRAGCSHLGLATWIQEIVTGGIIVAAVALDRLRKR